MRIEPTETLSQVSDVTVTCGSEATKTKGLETQRHTTPESNAWYIQAKILRNKFPTIQADRGFV